MNLASSTSADLVGHERGTASSTSYRNLVGQERGALRQLPLPRAKARARSRKANLDAAF